MRVEGPAQGRVGRPAIRRGDCQGLGARCHLVDLYRFVEALHVAPSDVGELIGLADEKLFGPVAHYNGTRRRFGCHP